MQEPVRSVEAVFRQEYGRAVSVLVRAFGDIDLAEEGVQEAFAVAAERWGADGLPPSPAGWIITTARRKVLDRLRREASRDDRHAQSALLYERDGPDRDQELAVQDDRLRLIFTCCHPALAPPARVALTLRLLGGLTTGEIAARVRRARSDHGAADHPGQGEDPRRRHSLPGAEQRGAARPPSFCARRRLSRVQRGLRRNGR